MEFQSKTWVLLVPLEGDDAMHGKDFHSTKVITFRRFPLGRNALLPSLVYPYENSHKFHDVATVLHCN
jgi:hypothetical protein